MVVKIMIKTDNIFNFGNPPLLRHQFSVRQHIESPREIKDKNFDENKHEIKSDKKEGRNKNQIERHQESNRKVFKPEIPLKNQIEKKENDREKHDIEGKKTDSSAPLFTGKTSTKSGDTKTPLTDEKKSMGREKTEGGVAEKKLINIDNTLKELRKAIDNLKTQNSPVTDSNKFLPEKTSIHRASHQSDPSVSYPVTREQRILASLVTGDVKPFIKEEKDKNDTGTSPEYTGEGEERNIKGNTVRGRFIRSGRRGKSYKDESSNKINYFFDPVMPRENSKKKLEEYLKAKYSVKSSFIKKEKNIAPPLCQSMTGNSADMKKNEGISKKTGLQSHLSRFLNQNLHREDSFEQSKSSEKKSLLDGTKISGESSEKKSLLDGTKISEKKSEISETTEMAKTQIASPVKEGEPVFLKPAFKLSTRQEKVEFFVGSLKNYSVLDIEHVYSAARLSCMSDEEVNSFLVWLSVKGKKFIELNDAKVRTMMDIFAYASGANGDITTFIYALQKYATSSYSSSGGVGKEAFEALAFIAGYPKNWYKIRDNIGKIAGGWSVGGVDFSKEEIKKELRLWLHKSDGQSSNPLVPDIYDEKPEDIEPKDLSLSGTEKNKEDKSPDMNIDSDKESDRYKKIETKSPDMDLESQRNREKKVEETSGDIQGEKEKKSEKSKKEHVQDFVDELVRKGGHISPLSIHVAGKGHGLEEEEVNRFITWLSEVDSGNINFNDNKVNMICNVFIAATGANKDMVNFAQTLEMSSSLLVGS
jgi:hypothetical protein